MNESQLPEGAQAKLDALQAKIAAHEAFLARTRKGLEEAMYRANGEATVQITTLGAVIKTRQLQRDADYQSLMRFRMKVAQLPAGVVLHEVPPPEPTEDETLESVRAEISALRAERGVLLRASDTAEDMLPIIERAVKGIPVVTPTITKDGTSKFPPGTHEASVELYGAGNDKAKLVKQRVATYTAQLGDDVVYAERATKLIVIGQHLDILERLEAVLVDADPEAHHNRFTPLFAFLSVEAVSKQRRAA